MREISHSYFNNASDFFISKLQPFHNLSVFIEVILFSEVSFIWVSRVETSETRFKSAINSQKQ